ncbi:hypothetical protein JHK84_047397 [Glycine max]|nr:hypothetical protein JHK87_047180 [Glycine soja]KAG5102428.1 hypothetical protein JHK84_047397 [Glycine max]
MVEFGGDKNVKQKFQIQHVSVSPKARSNMSFSSSVGSSSLLFCSTSCTKFSNSTLL